MSVLTKDGFVIAIGIDKNAIILHQPDLSSEADGWVRDNINEGFILEGEYKLEPGVYKASYFCRSTKDYWGEIDIEEYFSDFELIYKYETEVKA